MNKRERGFYNRYMTTETESVRAAYSKPSAEKIREEESIKSKAKNFENPRRFRAMNNGSWTFSYAFMYDSEDNTTHLRYYTAYNCYDFSISD